MRYSPSANNISTTFNRICVEKSASSQLKNVCVFKGDALDTDLDVEWQNNAKLWKSSAKSPTSLGKNDGKIISTWNFGE